MIPVVRTYITKSYRTPMRYLTIFCRPGKLFIATETDRFSEKCQV